MGPLVLLGVILWIIYKFWISAYKHWELRGIPFVAGVFPFGTSKGFFNRAFQGEVLDEMYKKIPGPYFGMYVMRTPFLVVKDPDIIKLVMAKEFSHFRDRQGFKILKDDLLSHNLFNLEGERWKPLRMKMSPAFSSGKLKGMFPLFISCAEALNSLLLTQVESTVNIKDIVGCFTTDTICSCAFGIESSSMKSTGRDVRDIGRNVLEFDWKIKSLMWIWRTFPNLGSKLPFRIVSKDIEDSLIKFMKNTIEYRKKNDVKRNDFLDLLLQLKEKGKLNDDTSESQDDHNDLSVEITLELMTAQCYVFFVAGFETSSSVQSYCLYELALNPDIQERLYNEIETTITKHGALTYQAIQEMEYLDMVVSETLRKYPTLPFLTRSCTKPFSMPAGNRIEVGDNIFIPTWSLHRDPLYFPKPEVFDPQRFSAENKEKIVPYSYLPFGEGPRMCIGMRFGLLQTKVGLITILRKYKVAPSEKTKIPLTFKGSLVVLTTDSPIYLNLQKRSSSSES